MPGRLHEESLRFQKGIGSGDYSSQIGPPGSELVLVEIPNYYGVKGLVSGSPLCHF